ncbi:Protein SRT-40, partial [Aphelenchoides avenae]
MNLLLFHREDVGRLYNCSYSVDTVPLGERKHPVVGYILIALTIVYEASYIPCLIVFARHKKNSSCYKIMLFLGVCDVINLVFVGFFMGLVTINGWVYCSSPVLMHFVGTIAP